MVHQREDGLVKEIRFNQEYAHLLYSEYKNNKYKSESIPTIKKKTLRINDYVKRLSSGGITDGVIPANCRYIEQMEGGHLVVIEEPPAYRTIKTTMGMRNEIQNLKNSGKLDAYGYTNWMKERKQTNHASFVLAFPYVIFIFYVSKFNEVSSGQVYLRSQQMVGMSDYLLKMPMCNISNDGFICFGDKIYQRAKSFTAAIQHAIMVWWSAIFNTDYTYNYTAYKNTPILNSYLEWQYMSQENPMFIYNADWIKIEHTLGERLTYTKSNNGLASKKQMQYKELVDVFYQPQDTGMEVKASPRSKKTIKMFYDIAQGTYLDRHTNISVGDSFETKSGKIAFIDSFIGFPDGSEVKYIQIDINGRLSSMKVTENCRKFLAKKVTEIRRADQVTLSNGTLVKPDQILIITRGANEFYYKVDYIRKSRGLDGEEILEVKMGNDYYLSSNLDAKEFKLDNPEINGIKLNKTDDYIIISDVTHAIGAKVTGHKMKFKSIDVSGHNQIVAKFTNSNPDFDGHDKRIELTRKTNQDIIHGMDKVKELTGRFRIGRKLYIVPDGTMTRPKKDAAWGVNGAVAVEGNYLLKILKGSNTKTLINDNRFFIEGADFDTEFLIGDKVVVANWDTPLDVLTVKLIQGFKYNESNGDIHFILLDKEENLSEVKYVDGNHGVVNTGKVRKVSNKVGRLSAGTKIRAEVAGIPCFPKKDINIIVAFIIDTNREPLVLCSNGCTLWYNDVVENFKKVTLKSKQWPILDHAPLDLSKIKFQAGDIINGVNDYKTRHGYLLHGPSTTRALRAMPMESITTYPESFTLDQYMTRECRLDCIPAPRISPAKIEEAGVIRGLLDLSSFNVYENRLSTRYLNQRRG